MGRIRRWDRQIAYNKPKIRSFRRREAPAEATGGWALVGRRIRARKPCRGPICWRSHHLAARPGAARAV